MQAKNHSTVEQVTKNSVVSKKNQNYLAQNRGWKFLIYNIKN